MNFRSLAVTQTRMILPLLEMVFPKMVQPLSQTDVSETYPRSTLNDTGLHCNWYQLFRQEPSLLVSLVTHCFLLSPELGLKIKTISLFL